MSSPAYYDDGNFTLAAQNGPTTFSFPFADRGDKDTFVARTKMRQDYRYYRKPQLMIFRDFNAMGRAYLVNVSDTNDVGQGILEWEQTWARIPVSRSEYGSITYTQQYPIFNNPGFSIFEYTSSRDARTLFEYSIDSPLPRILAPRLFSVEETIVYVGNWTNLQEGQEILAQDTESEIYMAGIYCRKSVFIEFHQYVTLV